MGIYENSGLLRVCLPACAYWARNSGIFWLRTTYPSLSVISRCLFFLGRDPQRHNDADVERERRARARSFVRSANGSRKKETTVVLTPLCRRQRRKDVSAETFSDRRGASRASRRRESRGNHDPARDRRDGRCGNARGREVRGCDAMIFVFARARFVGGG